MSKFIGVIAKIAGVCLIAGVVLCLFVFAFGGGDYFRNTVREKFNNVNPGTTFAENADYQNYDMTFSGNDIENIDVDLPYGELIVETGDEFRLVVENGIKGTFDKSGVSGNTLRIIQDYESHEDFWNFFDEDWSNYKTPKVTLYVPEDFNADDIDIDAAMGSITVKIENFTGEMIKINAGMGRIDIDSVDCREIKLECGMGSVNIDKIKAKEGKIQAGAGDINIKNGELDEVKIDCGQGSIDFVGKTGRDVKFVAGMGEVVLTINGSKDDYYIDAECGMGTVSVDGNKIDEHYGSGSASNKISVDAGMGSVNVKFAD